MSKRQAEDIIRPDNDIYWVHCVHNILPVFLRDQQEMAPEKRKRRSKTSSWFINCTINSQKLREAWPTIRGSRRQAGSSAEADAWLRKRGRPGRLPGARVERWDRNFTGFGHFSPFHLFPGKDRENPQPGKQAAEVSHRSYKHVFPENMPFACNFRENEINSLCPEGELVIKKKKKKTIKLENNV